MWFNHTDKIIKEIIEYDESIIYENKVNYYLDKVYPYYNIDEYNIYKEKIESFNNKELFIESITGRQDYKNLLFYTMNNRISKKTVTIEVIDGLYKELIGKYFELIKIKLNQGKNSDLSLKQE